jgi:hypothetical protein
MYTADAVGAGGGAFGSASDALRAIDAGMGYLN